MDFANIDAQPAKIAGSGHNLDHLPDGRASRHQSGQHAPQTPAIGLGDQTQKIALTQTIRLSGPLKKAEKIGLSLYPGMQREPLESCDGGFGENRATGCSLPERSLEA